MKNLFSILFWATMITAGCPPLQAQTTIAGGDVSGIWDISGSPYIIEDDISISPENSLRVEAGVRVEFMPGRSFVVQGSLMAEGTMNDSIFFTARDTSGSWDPDNFENAWRGLRFINTESDPDSSLMSYCRFDYSRADSIQYNMDNGGAVAIEGPHKIRISNCLFEKNSALGGDMAQGGALFIKGGSGMKILKNTFRNNTASFGGAVSLIESSPVLQHNRLENNKAEFGGGYFVEASDISIYNETFKSNAASGNGGAVLIAESADRSSVDINSCSFSGNYAAGDAGCIEIGNGVLRCYNSKFTNNSSDWIGGVFKVYNNSFLELVNCELRNNSAPVFGGIMGSYESFIELEDCIMNDNTAGTLGGAIHSDWSQLAIRRCVFERDSSGETGGAFWLWHCNAEFEDCNFLKCTAGVNSGAIGSDSTNIRIDNSEFKSNQSIWGGAVGFSRGDLEITGSRFQDNKGEKGGAVNAHGSLVVLTNNEFEANSSVFGGALNISDCSTDIESCSFTDNTASDNAGVIEYTARPSDISMKRQIRISHSDFSGNHAANSYGAVYIEQFDSENILESVVIDNCMFKNNEAGSRASLDIRGNIRNTVVSDCIFDSNISHSNTSVFGILNSCKGSVFNCLFTGNQPRSLLVHGESYVDVTNCTFAKTSGAGIDIRRGGTAKVTNSIFWDNGRTASIITAAELGSKIYLNYCDVQFGPDSIFPSDSLSKVFWGEGNIMSDPEFTDSENNNYSLHWTSPCLEAGISSIEVEGSTILSPDHDIEGNPRPSPSGTNPDMGAYESAVPAGSKDPYHIGAHESRIWIIPNPVRTIAEIKWFMKETDNARIDLLDISGKYITTICEKTAPAGMNMIDYDFSPFRPGIYIIKYTLHGESMVRRVVKSY